MLPDHVCLSGVRIMTFWLCIPPLWRGYTDRYAPHQMRIQTDYLTDKQMANVNGHKLICARMSLRKRAHGQDAWKWETVYACDLWQDACAHEYYFCIRPTLLRRCTIICGSVPQECPNVLLDWLMAFWLIDDRLIDYSHIVVSTLPGRRPVNPWEYRFDCHFCRMFHKNVALIWWLLVGGSDNIMAPLSGMSRAKSNATSLCLKYLVSDISPCVFRRLIYLWKLAWKVGHEKKLGNCLHE